MRRFISFLLLLLVLFIAIGFWRGWFTLFINQGKMQHDEQKVEHKLDRGAEKLKEQIHSGAKKVEQKTDNSSAAPTTP